MCAHAILLHIGFAWRVVQRIVLVSRVTKTLCHPFFLLFHLLRFSLLFFFLYVCMCVRALEQLRITSAFFFSPIFVWMSEVLTLHSAWDVDRHIVLDSAEKLVLVRFSSYTSSSDEVEDRLQDRGSHTMSDATVKQRKRRRSDEDGGDGAAIDAASLLLQDVDEHYLRTRQMDALLQEIAPKVRKYCTIFLVDTREVTAFNELYELGHDRDPFAVMFFYRNRHIRVDVGTGNNNKVNFFAFEDIYDFLPIVDAAYKAGKQGRSITSCDKKFSTVALRR